MAGLEPGAERPARRRVDEPRRSPRWNALGFATNRGPSKHKNLYRALAAAVLLAVILAVVLRVPSAVHDFIAAFSAVRPERLGWIVLAVVSEFVSFVFYARIQRALLAAGGEHVRLRFLVRLAIASSGLRDLLPAGTFVSSGWLYEQYRRLETPPPVSLFVVLASGFVSTVTLLGLMLVSSAIAGVASALLLAVCGGVLVLGSAGFVAGVHRLGAIERLLGRRAQGRYVQRAFRFARSVAICRVGWRQGGVTFCDAGGNWLADVACLIAAFELLGERIPWRGLLFAYCASQLAGSVVPTPGGLGAVEGGMVGALDVSGIPVGTALATALLYRVITYWGVALVGGIEIVSLHRHQSWWDHAVEDDEGGGDPGRAAVEPPTGGPPGLGGDHLQSASLGRPKGHAEERPEDT
ncbi:MAG: lysylphosphatidylglycerol synthase transmembrane domain-containing protein [Acidimicrobiales bacterium]